MRSADRTCAECHTSIQERHGAAKYCSDRCRDAATVRRFRTKLAATNGQPSTCNHCGSPFVVKAGRSGQYCSHPCYIAHRKARAESRTEKACTICVTVKPLTEFGAGSGPDGTHSYCSACSSEVALWSFRRRKYGITREEYDTRWDDQDRRCAICRTVDSGTRAWAVDHDHTSGQVRGILCNPCNTGIGHLGDDPDRLLAAALYLIRSTSTVDTIG